MKKIKPLRDDQYEVLQKIVRNERLHWDQSSKTAHRDHFPSDAKTFLDGRLNILMGLVKVINDAEDVSS